MSDLPNPPKTIGRFTNVPDFGSEVRHEYYTDITQAVVDLENQKPGGSTTGRWQYNPQAGATPGGQQMTSETGDFTTSTWVRFADKDKTNTDFTALLMGLPVGSTIMGQQSSDSANRGTLKTTGAATDGGNYIEIPIEGLEHVGTGSGQWQEATVMFMWGSSGGGGATWPDPNPAIYADQRMILPNPADYPGSAPYWDAGQLPTARLLSTYDWDALPTLFGPASDQGIWITEKNAYSSAPQPNANLHSGILQHYGEQIFVPASQNRRVQSQMWTDGTTGEVFVRGATYTPPSGPWVWSLWTNLSAGKVPPANLIDATLDWNYLDKAGTYQTTYRDNNDTVSHGPMDLGEGLLVVTVGLPVDDGGGTFSTHFEQVWYPRKLAGDLTATYYRRFGSRATGTYPEDLTWTPWQMGDMLSQGAWDPTSAWDIRESGFWTTSTVSNPTSYHAPADAQTSPGTLMVFGTWQPGEWGSDPAGTVGLWVATVGGAPVMWMTYRADHTAAQPAWTKIFGDTAWTDVGALSNGWGAQGSPHPNVGYQKLPTGKVYLRGVLNGGSTAHMGQAAFTLPTGYRPPWPVNFVVAGGGGVMINININTAGAVTPQNITNTDAVMQQAFVPLNACFF